MEWLKRASWSILHPTKIREMRRAWRVHMLAIQRYHSLKLNFTRTKRQSGPHTLRMKRRKIRESGHQVVRTGGLWLDYSTELPWIT